MGLQMKRPDGRSTHVNGQKVGTATALVTVRTRRSHRRGERGTKNTKGLHGSFSWSEIAGRSRFVPCVEDRGVELTELVLRDVRVRVDKVLGKVNGGKWR